MKQPFNEARHSPHADPLDARVSEFDWSALLDDPQTDEDVRRQAFELAAEAIHRLLVWLTSKAATPRRNLDRLIGRRALAMVWVLRPDLIEGSPSLAKLARRIRSTRAGLSWHTSDFSRVFQLKNRAQIATQHHNRTRCE